jgi:hypothetical protein
MFTRRRALMALSGLALGLSFTAPTFGANALSTNRLTFSGPVRLPGVTLSSGAYLFERLDYSDPDLIVVRSVDRTKSYYVGLTRRVSRPAGLAADRLVTIGEAARGAVPSVESWFPHGQPN